MSDIKRYNYEVERLFESWKAKEIHSGKVFNRDGIVDAETWYLNSLQNDPKILVLLKEAYHSPKGEKIMLMEENGNYDLVSELKESGPWNSIWKRVAEWSYGISNTTASKICRYKPLTKEEAKQWLRRIAVVNIKKSGGSSNTDMQQIIQYAEDDKTEIKHQIEIIDPDIIVCGYTFEALNSIYDNQINKKSSDYNDNWFYRIDNRLVIDYYHPANRYPALLKYYGIVNIYQQALLSG
jgi:hypothetical protein